MAIAAVLLVGADERLVLKSPYNPDLVQALKDAVPYGYREWDGPAKVWRIDPDWPDVVFTALTAIGVTIVDKRPADPLPTPVAPDLQEACTRLCITPEAPLVVAEAAYKALARLHHPDVGGEVATMQALNEAIATFKAFTEVPF
jgi:hypothetical protein